MAREVQPAAKPTKARVEEKGARPSDPVSTAATGGWRTCPWPFTPRAEPTISFGGPVAEETFGVANDEEPVEKALGASPSVAVKSEDSVNSNLAILMVDSGASGHYFDDTIIRDLKHRLQDYVHLSKPRKILTAEGAMLDGTAEGVLQGLVTDDNGNQILVRVDIVVVPWIGRNLFSVMAAAKKGIATIFDYEKTQAGGIQRHRATTERERRPLLVRFGLECGPIWRQGASNERSRQCPSVAPAAGSSPCTEPGYSTQARRHWDRIRGGCVGLRRLRRGESSTACSP